MHNQAPKEIGKIWRQLDDMQTELRIVRREIVVKQRDSHPKLTDMMTERIDKAIEYIGIAKEELQ
jgi:hypothetical protein